MKSRIPDSLAVAATVVAVLLVACKDEPDVPASGLPPSSEWNAPTSATGQASGHRAPIAGQPSQRSPSHARAAVLREQRKRLAHTVLARPGSVRLSPDSKRAAFVGRGQGRQWLVVDDRPGEKYEVINSESITFSEDSQHLLYVAFTGDDSHLVVDGRELPAYPGILRSTVALAAKGQQHAFGFVVEGRYFANINGTEKGPYQQIMENTPRFSPDGKRYLLGVQRDDKWLVIVDGKESPPHEGVGASGGWFSPDSQRVAYLAIDDQDKFRAVIDGKAQQPIDAVWTQGVVFSPDSRHVAYAGRLGEQWGMFIDGRIEARHRWVFDIVFAADSQRYAYAAGTASTHYVVEGERRHPEYDGLNGLLMSPTGSVAYAARKDGKWTMVIDGVERGWYDEVAEGLVFSDDGAHFAFTARRGPSWYVVVDGQPRQPSKGVVVDSLAMSKDGAHVAFAYIETPGRLRIALDGWRSRETYDLVMVGSDGMSFDDAGRIHYLAGSGFNVYLVAASAPE